MEKKHTEVVKKDHTEVIGKPHGGGERNSYWGERLVVWSTEEFSFFSFSLVATKV